MSTEYEIIKSLPFLFLTILPPSGLDINDLADVASEMMSLDTGLRAFKTIAHVKVAQDAFTAIEKVCFNA